MKRSTSGLPTRLALASLGTAIAVGVVCAVGLVSLGNLARDTRSAVSRELSLIDEAGAFSALLYQKGFAAEYMLTRDRRWLEQLEITRPAFERWLAGAQASVTTEDARRLLATVSREYEEYHVTRRRAVELFDAGDEAQAKEILAQNQIRLDRILTAFRQFGWRERQQAEAALAGSERSLRRLARLLVGTAIAGATVSLLAGFLWARRITKPIYELQVQVESAAERTRIKVSSDKGELDGLGDQVAALIEKLEETDAALAEHRRRLIQSEKLSAVGELAAKLAHEVLNPLAGMKAAVQLLARSHPHDEDRARETARALSTEIARVEALLGRLLNFARPLSPRIQVTSVSQLLDAAIASCREVLAQNQTALARHESDSLPPLEVDPLLVSQAICNLLTNASQTMPTGGVVELSATRRVVLGREEVAISVADRGGGIAPHDERMLFHPFFTTKSSGHGLGLAISQNIAVEHGGRIVARNRPEGEGSGAIFDLLLPMVR
jgi:signal transduction histidine kinase